MNIQTVQVSSENSVIQCGIILTVGGLALAICLI